MKKVEIKNKNGVITNRILLEDPTEWLQDSIEKNHFGNSERIVDDVEGSYDPADVLEHIETVVEEATEELPAVIKKQVKLKAEYTIEITDISQEYALQQCLQNRKAEYPTPEEFMNAFFDGGDEAVQALQAKRLEIKAKYPKP